MNQLFIPILLGTAREGRKSEKAASYVLEQTKAYGQFETQLLDVRDFVVSPKTEKALRPGSGQAKPAESPQGIQAGPPKSNQVGFGGEWSEFMKRADGLIIVSPEYNHGYPGELKLMLDELYEEYNRKPVGICGVSGGGLGGARMVEALRTSLIELQMVPMRNAVYFANIQNLFDDAGTIQDASFEKKLATMFDELLWYAKALKEAREKLA